MACSTALVTVAGCAGSRVSAGQRPAHPLVAALDEPAATRPDATDAAPAEAAPDESDDPPVDTSAAEWLQRGFAHFQRDEPALAGAAFRAAVGTGSLNDAGRALAYWHIYLAERRQGHTELGADALESFVAAGQELLDSRGSAGFILQGAADFVERFELDRRMTRARALLSALWADRVATFGRSPARPVPVRSDSEVHDFLEHAPPCANATDRQTTREPDATDGDQTLERVTMLCHDRHEKAEYWFEKPGEP